MSHYVTIRFDFSDTSKYASIPLYIGFPATFIPFFIYIQSELSPLNPLMLQISKGGKRKYQSLGISVLPRYWDFTRNKPKPNCPNKEYIQKIILDKQTELQQRMLEFNSEQKEYNTTTLLNDENKKFELKTVCQFYQEQIEQCKVLCK